MDTLLAFLHNNTKPLSTFKDKSKRSRSHKTNTKIYPKLYLKFEFEKTTLLYITKFVHIEYFMRHSEFNTKICMYNRSPTDSISALHFYISFEKSFSNFRIQHDKCYFYSFNTLKTKKNFTFGFP